MWIKGDVVMLPTEEKATGIMMIKKSTNKLVTDFHSTRNTTDHFAQEIYILSDEEIKEGDWYLTFQNNQVIGGLRKCEDSSYSFIHCKKIIATTDKSLTIKGSTKSKIYDVEYETFVGQEYPLPKIPQSFIESFISEYNKGNLITKVMIEYEEESKVILGTELPGYKYKSGDTITKLKTNSGNTINIKPLKDN